MTRLIECLKFKGALTRTFKTREAGQVRETFPIWWEALIVEKTAHRPNNRQYTQTYTYMHVHNYCAHLTHVLYSHVQGLAYDWFPKADPLIVSLAYLLQDRSDLMPQRGPHL
jgi:hypothetical protein